MYDKKLLKIRPKGRPILKWKYSLMEDIRKISDQEWKKKEGVKAYGG